MELLECRYYREDPAITIILGMPNTERNAEKYQLVLKNLVKDIIQDLGIIEYSDIYEELVTRLTNLLNEFNPTYKKGSIVYFISENINEKIEMPFVLNSTYFIDKRFHTKEILRNESKNEHYYVLTLNSDCSRLLEYYNDILIKEINDSHFPVKNKGYWTSDRMLNSRGKVQTSYKREFFKWIDSELQAYLNRKPHPIILAGTLENISTYKQIAHRDELIVGEIYGNFTQKNGETPLIIGKQANQVIQEYISKQKEALLEELAEMENKGRVEQDIANIYAQTIAGNGQKLFVDNNFYQEAIIDNHQVLLKDINSDQEGYTEDIINEIIHEVMRYGGEIIFVESSILKGKSPIFLRLRYSNTQ